MILHHQVGQAPDGRVVRWHLSIDATYQDIEQAIAESIADAAEIGITATDQGLCPAPSVIDCDYDLVGTPQADYCTCCGQRDVVLVLRMFNPEAPDVEPWIERLCSECFAGLTADDFSAYIEVVEVRMVCQRCGTEEGVTLNALNGAIFPLCPKCSTDRS